MTARVLVVDDEPALRDSVTYALEREGFDVSAVAANEAELDALRVLKRVFAAEERFIEDDVDVELRSGDGVELVLVLARWGRARNRVRSQRPPRERCLSTSHR